METDGSMYMFLSSLDSPDYYPDNAAHHFRVKLSKPISLDEHWYVALCEIRAKWDTVEKKNDRSTIIFCDLCENSVVNAFPKPVLRRLSRKVSQEFSNRQYIRVTQRYIETIRVYIEDNRTSAPSFSSELLEITLHFKRAVHHQFL